MGGSPSTAADLFEEVCGQKISAEREVEFTHRCLNPSKGAPRRGWCMYVYVCMCMLVYVCV